MCGVCDTPELWHGATGLRAHVRARAGAAGYLHIQSIYHEHMSTHQQGTDPRVALLGAV